MSSLKRILLTLALISLWSPSFLFIKFALQELPPITIAASRVTLAAFVLLSILLFLKRALPLNKQFWIHSSLMALFASVIPFSLFCYAEKTIESALASILNGFTPIFTAILAQLFIPTDRMTFQKGIGIAFGSFGLLLFFLPNLILGVSGTSLGMTSALVAALSYSISHIYAKKYIMGYPAFVAPAGQMTASSLMLIPFALWYENPLSLPFPSFSALSGVLGLALFGTVFAFFIYYKLLEHCGPTAISMVACFFPIGGMLLGFTFLRESFTFNGLIAAFLILLGLLIINEVIPIPFVPEKKPRST